MSRASRRQRREAQAAGARRAVGLAAVAVPVTAAEVKILAAGLAELAKHRHYELAGGSWVADDARTRLLRSAGTAAALGHQTVPVLLREVEWLATTRQEVLRITFGSAIARQMAELCDQLSVRGGVACQQRWTARNGQWGLQWDTEPNPGSSPAGRPELEGR